MLYSPFKFIVLFILILGNLSCENDSSKTETVDIDEFLPKSKKEYNYTEDTVIRVEENAPDSVQLLVQTKINNAEFRSTSELTNKKHFPDRLDYTQRFYHELSIDSILYELVVWEFEDSIHTVNAFYNWIDCFGKKCNSVRIGESQWIYDGAFQLFVDDSKLIYVATDNKMNQKLWDDLFQPTLNKTWNYHLYQPLKRKVQWLELIE
jgi:hypothetical protein